MRWDHWNDFGLPHKNNFKWPRMRLLGGIGLEIKINNTEIARKNSYSASMSR